MNPHCEQLPTQLVNQDFHRVLEPCDPRRPYRPRKGEAKSVIHWGQRKLLLSEIEFLTMFAAEGRTVVYAGAAPGTHVEYLARLFEGVRFVLVDPAPFTVRPSERIEIIQGLFTDELARGLAEQHGQILFLSDIRTADPDLQTREETEAAVASDMAAQQRWHLIMRPVRSMLKFRLPWAPGETEYLAGHVYLPVWGPVTTTECRLITENLSARMATYDHAKHEEQLFYFNTVTRPSVHEHGVLGEGLDGCYDCRAEVEILGRYLASRGVPRHCLGREVSLMSSVISRELARTRTLLDPSPDPAERKRVIRERQYLDGAPAYCNKRPRA